VLQVIAGNILGDGHIQTGSGTKNGIMKGNARYGISMIASSREYIVFLCGTTYAYFRPSALIPRPNTNIPNMLGRILHIIIFVLVVVPFLQNFMHFDTVGIRILTNSLRLYPIVLQRCSQPDR